MSPALWLDGLITALAVAAVGAALVFGVVASTEGSFATVATNLGYPLGDLALLAFVFAVITVTGWRPGRTWLFIAAGFAVFAVADTIYLYQAALGTYDEYGILDLGWPGGLPPRRVRGVAAGDAYRRAAVLRGWAMLLLPAGATLAALGLLLVDHYARTNELAVWLASAALLVGVGRFDAHVPREPADAAAQRARGDDRRAHRPRQPPRAARSTSRHAAAGGTRRCSRSSTSTASSPTTTPSAMSRATRCSSASAATSPRRSPATAPPTAWAATSSASLARAADAGRAQVVAGAARALGEHGEGFRVGCSYGMVVLAGERRRRGRRCALADQRMYANKRGAAPDERRRRHVLLAALGEHDARCATTSTTSPGSRERRRAELGLDDGDVDEVRRAAELHDVGKIAIPDAILHARPARRRTSGSTCAGTP